MLNNRTASYEDNQKNIKFFYYAGRQHYTGINIKELELDNATFYKTRHPT